MTRSLFNFDQKKSTKKNTTKVFSSGIKKAVKISSKTSSGGVKLSRSMDLKKAESASFGKKVKRYAKQGVKSMLLSQKFHTTFKVLVGVVVCSSLLYASYRFIGKSFANEVVVSQSEIIARVAKLTPLPSGEPYEIVRVQDGEDLKKQNPFYQDIKEGDYILMYKEMAVIYDLRNDTIVNMKKADR